MRVHAVGRRTVRGVVAGAAGLLVVAGLTGCAGQPGAAAVVDGRVISQAELAQAHEDLAPVFPDADAAGVLSYLVVAPFFLEEAAERGVGVSQDDAREVLRRQVETTGGDPDAEFSTGALDVIRFSMAVQSLGARPDAEEALTEAEEALGEADIVVNPRYGSFDPDAGMTRPTYEWLVPTA